MTPAKQAALARLHASRRGVRVHPPPPPELEELAKLAAQGAALTSPIRNPGTLRNLARQIGVNDKTLARWLRGEDRPARGHHAAIRRVARHLRDAIAELERQRLT